MFNSLKKDGALIITTPNKRNLGKVLFPALKKKIVEENEWCYERHGNLQSATDIGGHISEMTVKELNECILKAGFDIVKRKRGSLAYGGKWWDNHRCAYLVYLNLDILFDFLRLYEFSWDQVVLARKTQS